MVEISLITPTYNSAQTVHHCLQSVGSQTIHPEHIIIDGKSTDDTLRVIDAYTGHRLKVSSDEDLNLYDAINRGIGRATGEVVGLLNSDDFFPTGTVLQNVAALFTDETVDACYGDLCYVHQQQTDKVVRYWRSGHYSQRSFYWGWMPPHPTFYVRRRYFESLGSYNIELGSAADYELLLRFCLKHGLNIRYLPEVMVHMRVGGVSNRSLQNRLAANRQDRKAWLINGMSPYPWTLVLKPLRKIPQWFSTRNSLPR